MPLLIGFLTFVLVVNCLFLMLLVLIQLPKKEAGAGIAFGGGATDALFGAGSGNALTKLTKYAAGTFLGLALLLAFLNVRNSPERQRTRELQKALAAGGTAAPAPAPARPIAPAPTMMSNQVLQPVTNITLPRPLTTSTNTATPSANTATPATNK